MLRNKYIYQKQIQTHHDTEEKWKIKNRNSQVKEIHIDTK